MNKEQTQQKQADLGQVVLHWEMPEYSHHEKGKNWYFIMGIIVLAIIVYGLITAEYTMVLAFALLAGVYFVLHNEPPKNISFTVTTLGLLVDKSFYQFSDIQNFWIVYTPPNVKVLYLRPARRMSSDIRIELMDQNPMMIRELLKTQIKESVGEGEGMTDKIARWLKL